MARIRTIKPEMARHEGLYELEQSTGLPIRFAWAMLPTACDKEGRFRWRPNVLKLDVLPFDDCDFSRVLDAWLTRGQVVKYRVGHAWFGWIPTWKKHQVVNNKERDSEYPPVDDADEVIDHRNQAHPNASSTREPREDVAKVDTLLLSEGEGEGEGERNNPPSPPRGARKRESFVPPSVDEVRTYCQQRKNSVDAEAFVAHYQSNGWKVGGRAAMKDWKAAVVTWEKNNFGKPAAPGQKLRLLSDAS